MSGERPALDWNTWLWWISLTAISTTSAVVLMSMIIALLGAPILGATGDDQAASAALQVALAPLFALAGAVVGFGQWIMLRGLILRAGWWILATASGWMAGYLWSYLLFPSASTRTSFLWQLAPWLLIGLTTGLCQWLVLRAHFQRSGLWVPVSVLAFAIGATGWLVAGVMGGAAMWLAAGAVSGWALLRLPRQPTWPV